MRHCAIATSNGCSCRLILGRPYEGLPTITIDGRVLDVADGIGAMQAYTAMLYGAERNDPAICAAWRELLLRYCKLDTMAMVLIWDYWRRNA